MVNRLLPLLLLCGTFAWQSPAFCDSSATPVPANDAPHMVFTLHREQLNLAGHVASNEHAQRLLNAARQLFAGRSVVSKFVPLDGLPGEWVQTTGAVLAALAATISSDATLTDRSLTISGVGRAGWPVRFATLRGALPERIELAVDVVLPEAGFGGVQACSRAFSSVSHGAINFAESGTEFRSSAFPVLERLLALADACRASTIFITGHSDASGDAALNRELSRARAQVVADYLAAQGIAPDRMVVKGVGSAAPVADNATRYGRSLNRRIEVEFRPTNSKNEF